MIACSKCNRKVPRHRNNSRRCRECTNEDQRYYRLRTKSEATQKYEKTKKGFLVRLYRNMLNRVTGRSKDKRHLYYGLEILPKEEFYEWALNNPDFHSLFKEWGLSGYERRLTPSVDRIDARIGYNVLNMEFVPFHENCRNIRKF